MYFVKKGCMSAFKGDLTLKGRVFSLMPLQFVCVSQLAPKIEPQLRGGRGGAACWWENMSCHFFSNKQSNERKQSSIKADYGFLKGWRAFLPEAAVILTNVLQTNGKINLLALRV